MKHSKKHEIACVDGKYYDTWDSGWCKLYWYFKKREVNINVIT